MLARAFHDSLVAIVSGVDFDGIVVGAGPAGAIAARTLATRGASVLLLDRSTFPRRKVCGACLSAGALEQLEHEGLGGLPSALGGVAVRSFVLHARTGEARLSLPGTVAVSRASLDHALVRAASDAGATFWPAARARLAELDADGRALLVTHDGEEKRMRARMVIDATGLGRGLSASGHSTSRPQRGSRVGLGGDVDAAGYPVRVGELHMAVAPSGYVGLVRVEDGRLNVAAAVDPSALEKATPRAAVNRILRAGDLPELPDTDATQWKGTPPLMREAEDFGAPRLLRIGDAAGYTEPFTGQGMAWALGDGGAAAALALRAFAGWRDELLTEWCRYRGTARRRSERLSRALAWSLRRPALVAGAMRLLRVAPSVAAPFVEGASRSPEVFEPVAV